jgi:large subunit ribosomal protein L28
MNEHANLRRFAGAPLGDGRRPDLRPFEEDVAMASVCELCGKKPSFGMSLSHSHRRTKRRWNPNIQRVRALVDGTPRRLHVCTSCLRAGKVTKPARRTAGV